MRDERRDHGDAAAADGFWPDEDAQARALEGITAAFLVLGAVLFAIQSAVVTPLTASTANQFLEDRQESLARDTLAKTAARDQLRPIALYWNLTSKTFDEATQRGYVSDPPLGFGDTLAETLGDRRVAYNVNLYYALPNGSRQKIPVVYQGAPTDDAVTATTHVTVYDDAELTAPPNDDVVVSNTTGFYAPDASPDSSVYNVLEVEVVVWQS